MEKSENTQNQPRVSIRGQYIKDLSFENPNAPRIFVEVKEAPKIELNLDIYVGEVDKGVFEVGIKINAGAKSADNSLFLVSLDYAGLFLLENIPDDQKEMILLIHCPSIIFPFARRIIADATRDGGFQPLMIEPIDFASLYEQKKVTSNENSIN